MLNIEHFSYLIHQYLFLIFGIFFLLMAAFFMLSGYAWERYHDIVSRAAEPKRFWWAVVFYFLTGIFFIGFNLYNNSN